MHSRSADGGCGQAMTSRRLWRERCEGTRIVFGKWRGIGVALGGAQPEPRNAFGKRHGAGHAVENRDTNRLLQIARKIRHPGATEHDRFRAVVERERNLAAELCFGAGARSFQICLLYTSPSPRDS